MSEEKQEQEQLFEALVDAVDKALSLAKDLTYIEQDNPILVSITQQILFIKEQALLLNSPLHVALGEGKPFTFGILSSKHFASPDEWVLKNQLGHISQLMDAIKVFEQ